MIKWFQTHGTITQSIAWNKITTVSLITTRIHCWLVLKMKHFPSYSTVFQCPNGSNTNQNETLFLIFCWVYVWNVHKHCSKQRDFPLYTVFHDWNIMNETHFPQYPSYLQLKCYKTPSTISAEFYIWNVQHIAQSLSTLGKLGMLGTLAQCPLCCWSSLLIGYIMAGMEGWVEFHELLPGIVTVT